MVRDVHQNSLDQCQSIPIKRMSLNINAAMPWSYNSLLHYSCIDLNRY